MAEADIIGAITEWLKADPDVAGLAAARVFGGELPDEESKSMPRAAIVIRPSGGASLAGGSYARHDTQRVDLLAYDKTPAAANALARLARRSLTSLRRSVVAGCLIHWIEASGGFTAGRDRDAAWPVAFQSFQAFYALKET